MAEFIGWTIVLAFLGFTLAVIGRKTYRWWHRRD